MEHIKHRIFSIYLPQFHPFDENNRFWGKGFTEWHNVTSARSLFKDHYQPQLPSELGFYDLRLPEIMQQQNELAAAHGIDGFIFYHYWFNGKPVMEKPLYNYLHLPKKLPYYFCWANENWNRRWDGTEEEVLLHHEYSEADDEKHFQFLLPFFRDEQYVKINNRPVLAIYRPHQIPYLKKWVQHINELARQNGFDGVYLIFMINLGIATEADVMASGFDAAMVFQPSWKGTPSGGRPISFWDKLGKLLYLMKIKKELPIHYRFELISYPEYVQADIQNHSSTPFKCFYSLFPAWDNSSRRKKGGGKIFIDSTPDEFKKWLTYYYANTVPYSPDENFIVINAWNEWAEGNHLEPCGKWGRAYLEKIREVVNRFKTDEKKEASLKTEKSAY